MAKGSFIRELDYCEGDVIELTDTGTIGTIEGMRPSKKGAFLVYTIRIGDGYIVATAKTMRLVKYGPGPENMSKR